MAKLSNDQLREFLSAKEGKLCSVCKRRPHMSGCLHCVSCVDAMASGVIPNPKEDRVNAANNRPTAGIKPKQGELF